MSGGDATTKEVTFNCWFQPAPCDIGGLPDNDHVLAGQDYLLCILLIDQMCFRLASTLRQGALPLRQSTERQLSMAVGRLENGRVAHRRLCDRFVQRILGISRAQHVLAVSNHRVIHAQSHVAFSQRRVSTLHMHIVMSCVLSDEHCTSPPVDRVRHASLSCYAPPKPCNAAPRCGGW